MDVPNIMLAVTSIGFVIWLVLMFLTSQVMDLVNSVRGFFRDGSLTAILLPTLFLVSFTASVCVILRYGFDLSAKNVFEIFETIPSPIASILLLLLMAVMYLIIITAQLFAGSPQQEKGES